MGTLLVLVALAACARRGTSAPEGRTYDDYMATYDHHYDAEASIEDGVVVVTFRSPCPGGTCGQTLELGPAVAVKRLRLVDLTGAPIDADAIDDDDGEPLRQGEGAALFELRLAEQDGRSPVRVVLVGAPEHGPRILWQWPGPDDDASATLGAIELVDAGTDWLGLRVRIDHAAGSDGTPARSEVREYGHDPQEPGCYSLVE